MILKIGILNITQMKKIKDFSVYGQVLNAILLRRRASLIKTSDNCMNYIPQP